jgi:hypothetical protein
MGASEAGRSRACSGRREERHEEGGCCINHRFSCVLPHCRLFTCSFSLPFPLPLVRRAFSPPRFEVASGHIHCFPFFLPCFLGVTALICTHTPYCIIIFVMYSSNISFFEAAAEHYQQYQHLYSEASIFYSATSHAL